MTTFWAERYGESLRPSDPESGAQLGKLPFGKSLKVEVIRPRNARRHRLFWLMCERIGAAIGTNAQVISDLLKIETGHYTLVRSARYGDLRIPNSIAFSSMDETAFRDFFDACVVAVAENWGHSKPEVAQAMAELLTDSGPAVEG